MPSGFTKVSIRNFKSIRELGFSPRRVNVFIGDANTGKSNIIEALAVFSEGVCDNNEAFHDVLRFKTGSDLFYDRDLSETAQILSDEAGWSLKFESPFFKGAYDLTGAGRTSFDLDPSGRLSFSRVPKPLTRYYHYKNLAAFSAAPLGYLKPPCGSNLLALLTTNRRLRGLVADMFKQRGYRLVINVEASELAIAKDVEEELYFFGYPSVSETLRRIIFFMAIVETSHDAILLFDEPEANTFPFYTTYMAERIALDPSNQYFLTTHNSNILGSIVGKTPAKELAVFVTSMENYQTRVQLVPDEKLPLILDFGPDAFLNLDKLVAA